MTVLVLTPAAVKIVTVQVEMVVAEVEVAVVVV